MKRILPTLLATLILAAGSAYADKGGHGKGHGHGHEKNRSDDMRGNQRDDDRGGISFRFGDGDRRAIDDYYGPQFRSGKCPPGLAKKNNGCLPPGQAKKWNVGRPLPRDVAYYPLPHDLLVRLPAPPSGHKYVRVAGDILMIAVGTSMVVDAIQDIGR